MCAQKQTQRVWKTTAGQNFHIYDLNAFSALGYGSHRALPVSHRILLENVLRHSGESVDCEAISRTFFSNDADAPKDISFLPSRVLLQDLTGVPALVDLAAMRSAVERLGASPSLINPSMKVDLVIDHSLQVDRAGSARALSHNQQREFERNEERYRFLKWGAGAFEGLSLVPPGIGIVHQVNLEYLASIVTTENRDGRTYAFFDSLVGTDSHSTMINGLGVMGWGVGGIEAEASMLGQPISMVLPDVIGVELTGEAPEGTTSTDIVLWITQTLRAMNVVGKFVEFFGEGVRHLSLEDRATIANMAPEYGATMGFFPVDEKTLAYLSLTGREDEHIKLVEEYSKYQGLWHAPEEMKRARFQEQIEMSLSDVQPALAGPKRPQDRVLLRDMKTSWRDFSQRDEDTVTSVSIERDGESVELTDGAVVIAAITSCTNTSNPKVMLAAGLLAQKAQQRGLKAKPWVKTSLAPGSRVVTDYLEKAGLEKALEAIGFFTVGYGCTTCIGNSGPLDEDIVEAVVEQGLKVTSVLSGNRNFEGRVSPHTLGNYLASPPLVVAYALAGTVDIDFSTQPLAQTPGGEDVYLRDLWPTQEEIEEIRGQALHREQFVKRYSDPYVGSTLWSELGTSGAESYDWQEDSTYIQEPPFFDDGFDEERSIKPIKGARCLVKAGDSVTTDHISPAGSIALLTPAASYLNKLGVTPYQLNTYGTRRGNDQVMVRGTFGNVRFENQLAAGHKGGHTTYLGPNDEGDVALARYETDASPVYGEVAWIFDAAMKYQRHNIPTIILAGKDYGMGSSRDWAAKGPHLLGVKAVIASSYERIHRSNLIGMGILPLQFVRGEDAETLNLTGRERFDIELDDTLQPGQHIRVTSTSEEGVVQTWMARCRIDSQTEMTYYRNGGILQTAMRSLLVSGQTKDSSMSEHP